MIKTLVSIKQLKSENYPSDFVVVVEQNKDTDRIRRNYEYAKVLYDELNYTRSLEVILPLTKLMLEDKVLQFNINLLAGRILNEYRDNREAIKNITLEVFFSCNCLMFMFDTL